MMVTFEADKLERRIARLERDVKRVKELLELSASVNPFEWSELNDLDRKILQFLYERKLAGATTTQIAVGVGLENAETSGRVIVWKRLKKIVRVSKEREGVSILAKEGRRWLLNFDDFTFTFQSGES